MRCCVIVFLVCLVAGLDVRAGTEYPAKPGEEVVANELIVRLMPGATASTLIAKYLAGAQIQALAHVGFFRIRVPGGLASGISARIAADSQVDFVEPNRVRHAVVAAPNDPNYGSSWWFPAVQALQAWSLLPGQYLTAATAGTGRAKMAVLDTGADCTHPDFINAGGNSTDSAQGGQLMFSASQAIVATTIVNPACPWQDDHGHGTHVTGILAAATSNGIGVSGLGYPVQVIEYKILDSTGSGSDTDIMNAIEAAANAGAQVVSMSLGGTGYSSTLQTAINYAWQRNTLVVAAAGNDANNELFFPAGANHAVGVSATDSGNNLASFSNFGNSVQLAAPGVGILSTAPSYPGTSQGWSDYVSLSGTSMATPFVSGLAGLVAMTTPNATAAAILERMEQTASSTTTGGGWGQNFGYGIINASSAVSGTLRAAVNGAITGQIVDTSDGPISGAQITINNQTITTDTTGLYRFATLPAGTYPVTLSAPGKATQSLTATVAPGADTPLTVTMGVTYGKFTGTVTDQGLGVPGAIIQALSGGLITAVAIADQSGQYTLWVPGSGTYDVRASQIGRATTTLTGLTLSRGGTTSANLTLPRMGTIAGSVRDESANPVANAEVLVTGGTFSAAGNTDSNGDYSLIGVPGGTQYSATATATGFLTSTQSGITVSADVTTNVSFTMASTTVAMPTFNPPAGTYGSAQSVTISTTTSGASIRYTTDGSTPSSTVGTVYSGPVSVSSSMRLKAIAYMAGMTDSAVASAAYTIGGGGGPSWYNPSWTNRKAVTIDHTKVSANLTNFPMLFSVTDANLKSVANGGSVGKSDGTDILFTASDGVSKLDHAVELYSAASGQVAAWVRIPSLSSTVDTVIYVYFGNPSAADQQNGTGVWDSNFKGVWHMNDGGSPLTDSTLNGNAAGTRNGTPAYNVAGEIGNAVNFSAGAELATSSTVDLSASSAATLEAWVNGNLLNDSQEILNFGTFGLSPVALEIAVRNGGYTNWGPALAVGLGTSGLNEQYAPAPSSNAWHHIVATYDTAQPASTEMKLYIDGVAQPLTTYAGNNHDNSGTLGTAALYFSGYLFNWYQWTGKLDEVRISNLVRPSGWIATEYSNQSASAAFYSVGSLESPGILPAATPTFAPPAGAYGSAQSVTISTTTSGASIRYTTDGSTPSSTVGTVYANPVSVGSSMTLKAIAYMAGMTDSAVASGNYTITIQAATPTFAPPAGTYGSAQSVIISTTTVGASIRYTTDGSTPSSTVGTVYANPVSIGSNLTLKAIAYMAGMTDSAVASGNYTITIQAATPTFAPPAGAYGSAQSVTISTTTSGASIRYTTDGSTPSSTVGTVYANPVSVGSSMTLKAIAYMAGMTDSAVASGNYTITIQAATPTFAPPAGAYGSAQSVIISTTTVGASIRYTTDGSTPSSTVGTVYANPVSVGSSMTLKAIAYAAGMTDSSVASAAYTIGGGGGPSWYNPSWTNRKAVTIDHTKVSANLTNFPMLFSVTDANLKSVANGGSVGKSDGTDILFTASDGVSKLDHAVELYSAASGQVAAWVRIPSLSSTVDTVIYVYFGNPSAADQQNGTGVWDSNFKGVWHMNDGGSPLTDSTLNGNAAGTRNGTPAYNVAGEIGNAVNFSAGAELATSSTVDLSASSAATLEAWVNGNLLNDSQEILNFGTFGLSPVALEIAVRNGGYTNWGPALAVGLGTSGLNEQYAPAPSSNAWHHIVATYDTAQPASTEMKLYIDGVAQPLTTYAGNNHDNSGTLGTAALYFSGYLFNWYQWTGKLDEVRISNLVRPSGWIATEYSNQSASAAFYSVGSLESPGILPAATPTFAPPAGAYGSAQSVTISTTTSGASIRYTTDGSTPSSTVGTVYANPVSVGSSMTLKAIAYMAGMTDSAVASGNYTITIQAATPTFAPPAGTYGSAQSVIISTTTVGASIRYTTDGSTPSSTVGTVYANPVSIGSNLTLKAIAYMAGMTDSAVASGNYTITIQAATPTFAPPAGAYGSAQSVTISTTTSGASIRYTTDGSTPSSTVGTVYANPVSVGSSMTLKAIAYMAGMTDSAVASGNYTITIQAATPTFAPPAGTYGSAQSVIISTTTVGASIRYTTDGSTPSSTVGTVYANPVSVGSSMTLKAIAYAAGMTDSSVASAAYTIGGGGGPSWYNPSWTNRKAVTIDHTKVSANLTNFPMLFSVTDANLKSVANGGSVGKSDGTDILFTASDGVSKLDHAVELYSAASGQVAAWVRIPSLSSTVDTVIYVYFGNPSAADQQNGTGVWDSNFKGVWHMNDGGSPLTDSTLNGNAAGTRNGTPAYNVAGEIGNAVNFSAGAELATSSTVDLSASSAATLEAWVNGNLLNDSQEILNFGTFGLSPVALEIAVRNGGYTNWGPALAVGLGTSGLNEQYAPAPSSNAWHHIVATYDTAQPASTEMKLYIDGVAQPLTTYAGNNHDNSGTLGTAALYFSGYLFNWYQWTGKLDEVRISNLVRPSGWIATEYSNQSASAAFYSVGPLQ